MARQGGKGKGNQLLLLVNTNRSNVKVSIGECTGVVIDEVGASSGAPISREGFVHPITAKSQVDDDVVGCELLTDIAPIVVGEEGSRGTLQRRRRVKI